MGLTITKEQCEEFLKLDKERSALDQKSRALKKRTDALKSHFKAFLAEQGKDSVKRNGFQLTLVDGKPSVSWKDEFVRVAGPLAADEVLTNAERSKGVEVTPVS